MAPKRTREATADDDDESAPWAPVPMRNEPIPASGFVTLTIGGESFFVSVPTLLKIPYFGKCYDAAMTLPCCEGRGFCIDRDGACFKILLDVARGRPLPHDMGIDDLKSLLAEAEYFQMDTVAEVLRASLEAAKPPPAEPSAPEPPKGMAKILDKFYPLPETFAGFLNLSGYISPNWTFQSVSATTSLMIRCMLEWDEARMQCTVGSNNYTVVRQLTIDKGIILHIKIEAR